MGGKVPETYDLPDLVKDFYFFGFSADFRTFRTIFRKSTNSTPLKACVFFANSQKLTCFAEISSFLSKLVVFHRN